jgi:hypothetical protein
VSEASETFWRAFCHSGSCYQTCICKRVHFARSSAAGWDWGEGELEKLNANALKKPDLYFPDDQNDSISWMDLGRGPVVWGCPCHGAAPYENFIWQFKDEILTYLSLRAEQGKNEQGKLEAGLKSCSKGR